MPTGRLRPSQETNTPPAVGQSGKHGLGKGDLRMGHQDDGQVGQRHGDLGQVLALDD